MRSIQFVKMQGLGNDFVVVEGPAVFTAGEVAELCDRRRGIGADGILAVTRGESLVMEYWNADGSAAEMCGNGLRCVARYAYDRGWVKDSGFTVMTPIGPRTVRVETDVVEAELGPLRVGDVVVLEGRRYTMVDVGNPHAVTFVDDVEGIDVERIGNVIQGHVPGGVNVEYAKITAEGVGMRVWERGVGETLACGTGMAAVAAAAQRQHGVDVPLTVVARGGAATIDIRAGVAWMRGPVAYSFTGSVGGP